MAALFGYRRGVLGGQGADRRGVLSEKDGSARFLDEVDELGPDDQAMIRHAVETDRFIAVGSDQESSSPSHLIASASTDLAAAVAEVQFRPDLCARPNLWAFRLPALKDRCEDLKPNVQHEWACAGRMLDVCVEFNADAEQRCLRFAKDHSTPWADSFRKLGASVARTWSADPGRPRVAGGVGRHDMIRPPSTLTVCPVM